MRKYRRILIPLFGGLGGLAFGLAYYYGYACTTCADGSGPAGILTFSSGVAATMAHMWTKDT